ncbi:Rv3654c family TadE-like protein [Bifidobacterium aerophilum]|uniref:Rv3654c family TadE-like protein n=1 Tax=Bifidobacterium aerophilum TaxID=1798155 RepID=UPI00308438EF
MLCHDVWHGADRGSGTVAGVMLILLVGVLLGAVASAGNLLICQGRARASADLAVVSAASALRAGNADPCAVAGSVAQANDARIDACMVDGDDVQATLSVPTRVPFMPWMSRASRAGPVACG